MERFVIRVLAVEDCFIVDFDDDAVSTTPKVQQAQKWAFKRTAENEMKKLRKQYPDRRFSVNVLD